jgi:hypothetical protein
MRIYLLGIFACIPGFIAAQLVGASPYSAMGFGEPINGNPARYLAIGGATAATGDAFNINLGNPASYSKLALTNFEAGVLSTNRNQQQGDLSIDNNNYTTFNYVLFGFPLHRDAGLVLGVRPHTNRGFNIERTESFPGLPGEDPLEARTRFQGSGGLTNVVVGLGWEPFQKGFSIGANANYYFGTNIDFITSEITNLPNSVASRLEQEINYSHWDFDLGAQYRFNLSGLEFTFGGTYTFGNSFSQNLSETLLSLRLGANRPTPYDTARVMRDVRVQGTLASAYTLGFQIGKMHEDNTYQYAWTITGDYHVHNMDEFFGGESAGRSLLRGTFVQGTSQRMGATIIPAFAFKGLNRSRAFWNHTEYRIGLFQDEGIMELNDTRIRSFGTSFGIGVSLRNRSTSIGEIRNNMINFTVVMGSMGTTDNNLVRERFTQFLIGITISDKWFDKYKYR